MDNKWRYGCELRPLGHILTLAVALGLWWIILQFLPVRLLLSLAMA